MGGCSIGLHDRGRGVRLDLWSRHAGRASLQSNLIPRAPIYLHTHTYIYTDIYIHIHIHTCILCIHSHPGVERI